MIIIVSVLLVAVLLGIFFAVLYASPSGPFSPSTPEPFGCVLATAAFLALAAIGCMYLGKLFLP